MKRRRAAKRRQSVADLLMTPPQEGTPKTSNRSCESPESFKFKLNSPAKNSSTGKRRKSVISPVESPLKSSSRKRRTSAADLLMTPPQGGTKTTNRSSEPPKSFKFKLNSPAKRSGSGKLRQPVASPVKSSSSHRRTKGFSSISELKEVTSSRLDSIKRQVDHSYSDMFKDIDSSYSHLHKHFMIQTQVCKQFMDDIEKEFKKMSERIAESSEAMNVSNDEFTAEAEAEDTASRRRKTSSPEEQCFEKKFGVLRSHYGVFSMSP